MNYCTKSKHNNKIISKRNLILNIVSNIFILYSMLNHALDMADEIDANTILVIHCVWCHKVVTTIFWWIHIRRSYELLSLKLFQIKPTKQTISPRPKWTNGVWFKTSWCRQGKNNGKAYKLWILEQGCELDNAEHYKLNGPIFHDKRKYRI